MDKAEFSRLVKQGYKRIPLVRTQLADLTTPVGTYLKMANTPYSFLLESVEGGERWGRYSFIGLPAKRIYRVREHTLTILDNGKTTQMQLENPMDYVANLLQEISVPELPNLPRFFGGLVGYFAYETAAYTEVRLKEILKKADSLNCPHILLMETDELIVYDNLLGKILLICYAYTDQDNAWEQGMERLDGLERRLLDVESSSAMGTDRLQTISGQMESVEGNPPNMSASEAKKRKSASETYQEWVNTIRQYIKAGDVMQVVPSDRTCLDYPHHPFDFYRLLRAVNPAPYMFYFDCMDFHLAGASPEILVRLEDKTITLRPIAGTRVRGKTQAEDERLEKEMLEDPKERAEHVMLIDLGRNDLGRVSKTGSVRVTQSFIVEKYSKVMHIVSNIVGDIKENVTAIDLLAASLPAGTLSGAPKIRAMEIINELEQEQRGVYGGALGYLGYNGNMDLCIGIRTVVIKDGKIYIQAGGGIVADSQPLSEWEETLNKRKAIFQVLNLLGSS